MIFYALHDFSSQLPAHGRLLALDMGECRIGIAHSDASRTIASPYETYERRIISQDLGHLAHCVQTLCVTGIIFGYPLTLDGSENEACLTTKRFAEKLSKKTSLSGLLWDERFTTAAVTRAMRTDRSLSRKDRHQHDDRLAAAYLLQGVLDLLTLRD